ncbi:PolB [San Jacinto virus]|uniref:RNA-directed RNA polymerase n=1 Tax=San Jacinto virus TaxID=2596788 RepID=A0A516EL27_9MONO|nr:PolB [San Jacinto virus]QDO67017.1 PolB [San Jacinto virus]QFQ60720.1 polymerase B [San Jacinto virus]
MYYPGEEPEFGQVDPGEWGEGLQERKAFKPLYRRDLHLSTALLGGEVDYIFHNLLVGNYERLWPDHKKVADYIKDKDVGSYRDFIREIWALRKPIEDRDYSAAKEEMTTRLRVSLATTNVGLANWTQRTGESAEGGAFCPVLGEDLINHCLEPTIIEWFAHVEANRDEIKRVSAAEAAEAHLQINGVPLQCLGDIVTLDLKGPSRVIVAPYTALLAVAGMTNARLTSLLYARLADYQFKYPGYSLYQETLAFYRAADEDLKTYGEDIYSILKCMPSMAIGAVLKHTESKINSQFLETVIEDLPAQSRVLQFFTRDILTLTEAHIRLELSGLWKTMGHPFIEVLKSVNELRKKGTSPAVDTAAAAGEELAAFFKKYWCRAFCKRNHKWPPLVNAQDLPPALLDSYRRGVWDEPAPGAWSHDLFREIELEPHVDFDYSIDTSELLADRAMIHSRPQWVYTYNSAAHKVLYGRPFEMPPKENNRVILEYLKRPEVSLKEVIKTIEEGRIPHSWFAMVGVFKECELKRDKGRLFGKLTFEARLYQTATEHNLAEKIFPYVRGQSMTMTEEELKRTILKMSSSLKAYAEHDIIFISVDLSQWCTTWRHESAGPLLRVIDSIFGLNGVYNLTHLFGQVSGVLIQNKFWPPRQGPDGEPEEGPSYITNFLAWLEGLRQKGWTLATLLLIEKTALEYGTQATLLGQGDNQVICLRHPSSRQLKAQGHTVQSWADGFLARLEEAMARMGLILKPKESWISTSLFEYSREYHIGGCPVSRGLKMAAKLLSAPNSQIPTFNTIISSLYAAGAGLAGADQTPVWAHFLTTFLAQHHLKPRLSADAFQDQRFLTVLLSVGRTVGGLPIVPFSGFCYRGALDTLTTNLSVLKTLEDSGYGDILTRLFPLNKLARRRDPLLLVQDPEALPLELPVQPENLLRSLLSETLVGYVENRQLKPLFSVNSRAQDSQLALDLVSIKPCHPRLANLLYSLSNAGLRQKLIGQFSNTTSLQSVLLRNQTQGPLELHRRLAAIDASTFTLLEERRVGPKFANTLKEMCLLEDSGDWCSTVAADSLRAFHWFEFKPVGVTMAAPQEQYSLTKYERLPLEAFPNTLLVRVEDLPPNPYLQRGRHRPYFGSKTSDKVKRGTLQIIDVDKQISALKKILTLRPWIRSDQCPNLSRLLEILITEKTSIPIQDLEIIKDTRISGKVDHRVGNPTSPKGSMANSLLGFASHIFLTTDTATAQTRGGQDWSICYQTVFVTSISRLEILHRFGWKISGNWGAWTDCPGCTHPVNDHNFRLDRPPTYQGLSLTRQITELSLLAPPRLPAGWMSGREGLQIHYGRRLAFKLLSSLSPAASGGYSASASPDLNITELSRMDISEVICQARIYLDALRPGCLPTLQNDLLLSLQEGCLVIDQVTQALVVSGQISQVYRLAGLQSIKLPTLEGENQASNPHLDRLALLTALIRAKAGSANFYRDHLYVVPDDTALTCLRMALLAARESSNLQDIEKIKKLLSLCESPDLAAGSAITIRHIPPHYRPCVAASESTCCLEIRQEERTLPGRGAYHCQVPDLMPTGGKALPFACKQSRPYMPHLNAVCVAGDSVITSELLWLAKRSCNLGLLLSSEIQLITREPAESPAALAIWHLTHRALICQADPRPKTSEELERLINTGPLGFLGDPCTLEYSRVHWIASLLAGPQEVDGDQILIMPDYEFYQDPGIPEGSYLLCRQFGPKRLESQWLTLVEANPCSISPAGATWLLLKRTNVATDFEVPAFTYRINQIRRDLEGVKKACRDLWVKNKGCPCLNQVQTAASFLDLDLTSRHSVLSSLRTTSARLETSAWEMSYESLRWRAADTTYWASRQQRNRSLVRILNFSHLVRFLILWTLDQVEEPWQTEYRSSCHCHYEGGFRLCWMSCRDDICCLVEMTGHRLQALYPRILWPLIHVISSLPIE